mgnify:CR=1 FL=1
MNTKLSLGAIAIAVLGQYAAAETLVARKSALLFRVHEEPSPEKLDALRERQGIGAVDRAGLAPHVRLPRIATGLAAAPGVLLASECTTDLGTGGPDVHVRDPAVRSQR